MREALLSVDRRASASASSKNKSYLTCLGEWLMMELVGVFMGNRWMEIGCYKSITIEEECMVYGLISEYGVYG